MSRSPLASTTDRRWFRPNILTVESARRYPPNGRRSGCDFFLMFFAPAAHAGDPSAVAAATAARQVKKIDSGDTAWMLVSAALVLMMTGPGPGAVLLAAWSAARTCWPP